MEGDVALNATVLTCAGHNGVFVVRASTVHSPVGNNLTFFEVQGKRTDAITIECVDPSLLEHSDLLTFAILLAVLVEREGHGNSCAGLVRLAAAWGTECLVGIVVKVALIAVDIHRLALSEVATHRAVHVKLDGAMGGGANAITGCGKGRRGRAAKHDERKARTRDLHDSFGYDEV